MKTYDVKYDVGQEVYILLSKKIIKSRIEQIKVLHAKPYSKIVHIMGEETKKEEDGIEIEYLVVVDEVLHKSGTHCIKYEWYNQEDIYLNKNELIKKII